MTEPKDPLSRAETGGWETKFSRLEAELVKTEVEQRPNSRSQNGVNRHAETSDLSVNELNFDFNRDESHYPLHDLRSLQQVFDAVQCQQHLEKVENFSLGTQVECLDVGVNGGEWRTLDEKGMNELLQPLAMQSSLSSMQNARPIPRMLVFFVPLIPIEGTSYGSRILMTQNNANQLLRSLHVNPLFLLNMIGRPDYWAPQTHWEANDEGVLMACDLFCQHPRWNLHVQGAPLSVYMRHDITRILTTYIISHKEFDTSVNALKSILNTALRAASATHKPAVFMDDPFDIHTILSTLSFEASKFHVKRFQRFMWAQVNKVDDHLAGLETSDRAKLGDLTKQLQIISQNADSHIGNADVAIITATAVQDAHSRLIPLLLRSSPFIHQRVEDSISYLISSMQKQKIWFLNYKQRKDSTMSLVYNLVTQQDAANNIQIAHSMKQDSTSMNAIAALTMVFLPGTFTATAVQAGVFGMETQKRAWLIWVTTTVPLTLAVIISWWLYQRTKEPMPIGKWKHKPESTAKKRRISSLFRRNAI